MSSDQVAIQVQNISKCYQIYDEPRLRLKQFLLPRWQRFTGSTQKQYFREFWALNDVSFQVNKGETVGIVGRNGSGKSTLLQIICGVLAPSSGQVETSGRIAALLELGSGFNPEFTGRENLYMNGAILGLSHEEVDERFDDIVAFADIGNFLDQQVKTYSSGMMMRLAFAVAINVDPAILIIDEALSVGDELFQRKCFSKIEAIKQKGTTILFVSHSSTMIVDLCDRAVLIDGGEKIAIGRSKYVVGKYQKLLYAPQDQRAAVREQIIAASAPETDNSPAGSNDSSDTHYPIEANKSDEEYLQESYDPGLKPESTMEYASHGIVIEHAQIQTLSGQRVNNLVRGRRYRYSYSVYFSSKATNVRFGMLIKTISGFELGGAASAEGVATGVKQVVAGSRVHVEFVFNCILNAGAYFLNAGVMGDIDGVETYLHRILDVDMFKVMAEERNRVTGIVDFGCVPELEWSVMERHTSA
jgi:lipopolysaccharide transport system ATP-binding protein